MTPEEFCQLPDGAMVVLSDGRLAEKAVRCLRFHDGSVQAYEESYGARRLERDKLRDLQARVEYALLLEGHGTRV